MASDENTTKELKSAVSLQDAQDQALEIHLGDKELQIDGFFEQLLTI